MKPNKIIIFMYKSKDQKPSKITYRVRAGTMQPILDKRKKVQL